MNPYGINSPTPYMPFYPGQTPDAKMNLKDLEQEISWSESDIYRYLSPIGGNFDPVVRTKGLRIYEEMTEDDQIKTCLEVRKHARLSTPWNVVSGKEGNTEADMYADFIRHCLSRPRGTFEDDLYQIYSAIEFGFSISEKVYGMIPEGPFKGKIGLARIKTREPYYYDFKIDPHGNLEGITYIGPTMRGTNYPISMQPPPAQAGSAGKDPLGKGTITEPFPPEKFIIYSYNMKFGNWYGTSDLLAAFRSWIYKKHIMKFWGIWLERYASPFIVAQYKRDAGVKEKAFTAMDDFLRNMSARNGVRASDAWTLTPVQFSATSGAAYMEAINEHNKYMSHALLVPSLLGFSTDATRGSYSLGQKQFDAFIWILDKMGRDTEETIVGEQIIKPLMELNFPNVNPDLYPMFKFEAVDEMSIQARTNIVTMLSAGGFINPEEAWVRNFLTLPNKEAGIVLINPNNPNMDVQPGGGEQPQDRVPIVSRRSAGQGNKEVKNPKDAIFPKPPQEPEKLGESRSSEVINYVENKGRIKNQFEDNFDFEGLASYLDKVEEGLTNAISPELIKVRDALIKLVQKKQLIEHKNLKDLEKLVINPKGIKNILRNWLFKVYLDSEVRTLEHLKKEGVQLEILNEFSAYDEEVLDPNDAMELYNNNIKVKVKDKNGKWIVLLLALSGESTYFTNQAYLISGNLRDSILNNAKTIIANGIKRGDSASTIEDLRALFNKYIQQGIVIDDSLTSPYRMESIIKTHISEALALGAMAVYKNPEISQFIPYFVWSSVIDQNTTNYCLCMDQKKFGMERLASLSPPAHFWCRSVILPITSAKVNELVASGEGIKLDEPCSRLLIPAAIRFIGKKEPIQTIPLNPDAKAIPETSSTPPQEQDFPSEDSKGAEVSDTDKKLTKDLIDQLNMIITRCPYTACYSDDLKFVKRNLNVGEFECGKCGLPFRVSNTGDIYLYDAGTETWKRESKGEHGMPRFFSEDE